MINLIVYGFTLFIQMALFMAFILNIAKIEYTIKRLLLVTAIIITPNIIITAMIDITLLAIYIYVFLVILAFKFFFKQPWCESVFVGVFINFINVIIEYLLLLILVLLPEAVQIVALQSFVLRSVSTTCYVLLYIFSKRLKDSEYSPISHFSSIHWILYFFAFALLADYNLSRMFDMQFTIHDSPEIIVIILFLVFFLYNLIQLNKLSGNIARTLKLELQLENTQRELKLQKAHSDALRGFRHDFGNILNSIYGLMEAGESEKLKSYISEITGSIFSSQTTEIANNFKSIPALHGILLEKIYRAELRQVRLSLSITGGELDLKYCSDLDYTRMIGILLDNALESASDSQLKTVEFLVQAMQGSLTTIVINSCDKGVDIDRIFERDYSTKHNPSGEGLYQVELMVEKYRDMGCNIEIKPSIYDGFFTQTLKI